MPGRLGSALAHFTASWPVMEPKVQLGDSVETEELVALKGGALCFSLPGGCLQSFHALAGWA